MSSSMSYCIQVSRQRKPRAYSKVWKNWKNPAQRVRWQMGVSTPPAMPRSALRAKASRMARSAPGSMSVSASSVTTISPAAMRQPWLSESALPEFGLRRTLSAGHVADLPMALTPRGWSWSANLLRQPRGHRVGRAVVEHDDFVRRFRLRAQRREAGGQHEPLVARAHQHRQARPLRGRFQPFAFLPRDRPLAGTDHEKQQRGVVADIDQPDEPGLRPVKGEPGVEAEDEQPQHRAEKERPAQRSHRCKTPPRGRRCAGATCPSGAPSRGTCRATSRSPARRRAPAKCRRPPRAFSRASCSPRKSDG